MSIQERVLERTRTRAELPVALPIGPRTAAVLVLASLAGLMMLCWPLLLEARPGERVEPPFLFLALLPLVMVVVLAEMGEGGMDSRVLAVLGGRVFGAGFGFALGCTSLFASALLTAGVGPWLPFQMICAAWVGMGAGLLPRRVGGRAEITMLVVYAVVASYLYGLLMNLSFWPFALGIAVPGHEGSLAYVAGAPVLENAHRFLVYTLLTSTGGWDTGRAITTGIAIVVLGPAILTTLRRAARRAVVRPG
jgi:energy-coupling factor transport system substrate-specific component